MQRLCAAHGDDEIAVCDAYAEAERSGQVARPKNIEASLRRATPAAWRTGKAEGWLV